MSRGARIAATVLTVGGAALALAAAPLASADGADAVIDGLQARGYIVHINWTNGYDLQQLSYCTVININNPDHSGGPPKPGDTVYVDVRCPNDLYDGSFGFGAGVGVGGLSRQQRAATANHCP